MLRATERTDADRERTVSFVLGGMAAYRIPFFEQLRDRLAQFDIGLTVAYNPPAPHEIGHAIADLPWAEVREARRLPIGERELVWQPFLQHARAADLVVVGQHSRLLINYLLLAGQKLGGPRVALWGHGRNMQRASSPLGEAVKRHVSRWPHWWFAYNDLTVEIVEGLGYPRERITNVHNTVETTSLQKARAALTDSDLDSLRRELGLVGGRVGLACGTMYPLRQIPFLLEAAQEIRRRVPDFELICVGAGEHAGLVREAAATYPWIHYVGRQLDVAKVPYFALADVLLFSGPVGLGVVDGFALGVPTVARRSVDHGPEIAYTEDGVTSILVDDGGEPREYASAVASLLTDEPRLATLQRGAAAAAPHYSMENMVERFTAGLLDALATSTTGP